MTTTSHTRSPLLALAVALVAAPLAADEMIVRGEPLYQERVSFTDLDLRSGWAQQALRHRVRQASDRVCIQAVGPVGYDLGFGLSCTAATYDDARPQIRTAIARAKAGLPMAMSVVVSGSARSR